MFYSIGPGWPCAARARASGLSKAENPPYTISDFYSMYPQFSTEAAQEVLPEAALEMYIAVANSICKADQWGETWTYAMGLLVAHFATLHMQGAVPTTATPAQIAASGSVQGVASSKSVGSVSVSYDVGTMLQGLDEWGAFRLTRYGMQYATLAGGIGMAGMLV